MNFVDHWRFLVMVKYVKVLSPFNKGLRLFLLFSTEDSDVNYRNVIVSAAKSKIHDPNPQNCLNPPERGSRFS